MVKNGKMKKGKNGTLASLLIAAVTVALLFTLISLNIAPKQYDLKVGGVSSITITASKDVEDTVTTQQRRDAAERQTPPSYNADPSVMPEVMEQLARAFERVNALPELRRGVDGELMPSASEGMVAQGQELLALPESEKGPLPEAAVRQLIEADDATLERLTAEALRLVGETLNGKLVEGQEEEAIAKLGRDLLNEGFPARLCDAVAAVAARYLRPNMLLDEETTLANREKARSEVEPVIYKEGQNIVRQGEVITEPQIEMLNALGMLKDRDWRSDMALYLGIALLLLLLCALVGLYLYAFERDIATDPRKIALLCVISVIVIGWCVIVRLIITAPPYGAYLMPVALGAMLTAMLLKSRLAIVVNLAISVIAGLLASTENSLFTSTTFSVVFASSFSGFVCVLAIRGRRQRFSVMLAGLTASAVNALGIASISLINSPNQEGILGWAGCSIISALFSAVLCLGLQPVLEWVFNLDTNAKLTDLSNPNQPLLKRLMFEAPGTYHHSMIVANLSEAAANAVGANGLLARVGAYYHDIGKLKRPLYFKENQIHDNPHDRTDPNVSTAILTAHPRDGVEMGQKARLPHAVLEIVMQHHGDAPVLYFYDKAVKQGGDVNIEDFRYDGPRPKKPEAAIVMLADTIEAAARALTDATPDKLAQLIQRLVRSKMEDGQLDRCSLTFHDLNLVCEAFLTVLGGVYHERIEYPAVNIPERKRLDDSALEAGKGDKPQERPIPEESPAAEPQAEVRPEALPEREPEPDGTQESEDEA